jgi:hypothetical protein
MHWFANWNRVRRGNILLRDMRLIASSAEMAQRSILGGMLLLGGHQKSMDGDITSRTHSSFTNMNRPKIVTGPSD